MRTLFPKSIRWRFHLWIASLLACVLTGFGVTAYQLMVANQDHQIYEQLQHHLSAVASDLTARGRPSGPGGRRGHHDRWGRDERDEHEGRGGRDSGEFPKTEPNDGGARAFSGSERPPGERSWPERNWGRGPENPSPGKEQRYPNENGEVVQKDLSPERREPGFEPGRESPTVKLSGEVETLFDAGNPQGFYYYVWNREGVERAHSSNAPPQVELVSHVGRTQGPQIRTQGKFRESYLQHSMGYRVLVGRSIVPELTARRNYALWLGGAGAVILIAGLCGSWRLADRVLRPVQDISTAAKRISAGNLAERINVAETDNELGQLAGTLNSTFARLEDAFAQQQQFTADASHELRTPLAVMISEAQTTLARERTAAEYRETVEACLDTAQQMRRLTESLLELARFDASHQEIKRQPFDLAATVHSCLELIHPLADARAIKIQSDLPPVAVAGDASLLHQVITNLLTNGIHYNKSAGEIHVRTATENGRAVLTVSDTGKGIAPEDLPHIFKRFYRADKSRARADGRYGLGLAICKSIVDAHGGTIEAVNQPDGGTKFTLRLPLANGIPG